MGLVWTHSNICLGTLYVSGLHGQNGFFFVQPDLQFTNVVSLCNDHGRRRGLNISFAHGWCHCGFAMSWKQWT